MTFRNIDTGIWGDPFVEGLCKEAKLLYVYSWTNSHICPAGILETTTKRIAFETGIDEAELCGLIDKLAPKVCWVDGKNALWVKNFFRHQCKNGNFATAAVRSISQKYGAIAQEWALYNNSVLKRYKARWPKSQGDSDV